MQNTLVTGGTGFIGFNTVQQLLSQGRKVTVMARNVDKAKKLLGDGVVIRRGDLTDNKSLVRSLEGIDTVFHLAGIPEKWLHDPGLFEVINSLGTRSLARLSREAGVKNFIYASSIHAFEPQPDRPLTTADLAQNSKQTHFGRSMQLADRYMTAALEEGLAVKRVHLPYVYGAGQARFQSMARTVRRLAKGWPLFRYPGHISLVNIQDVVKALLIAETKDPGCRFILAPSSVPMGQVMSTIAQARGRVWRPPTLPYVLGRILSIFTELIGERLRIPPAVYTARLQELKSSVAIDPSQSLQELGMQLTSLEDGVRQLDD